MRDSSAELAEGVSAERATPRSAAHRPFFPPVEESRATSEGSAIRGLSKEPRRLNASGQPRLHGGDLTENYAELLVMAERKLARLPRGIHEFEAHSLLHVAYLRLMQSSGSPLASRSEMRFAMNRAMHDELVESARRAASFKHGGFGRRVELDSLEQELVTTPRDEALLEVHEAVMKLKQNEPVHARIVTLRFFGGLTMEEIAEVLDCSVTTVERKWRGLKEWLARELRF